MRCVSSGVPAGDKGRHTELPTRHGRVLQGSCRCGAQHRRVAAPGRRVGRQTMLLWSTFLIEPDPVVTWPQAGRSCLHHAATRPVTH